MSGARREFDSPELSFGEWLSVLRRGLVVGAIVGLPFGIGAASLLFGADDNAPDRLVASIISGLLFQLVAWLITAGCAVAAGLLAVGLAQVLRLVATEKVTLLC